MNGYAESFVASIKRECLNHFFCVSLAQVDYLIHTFTEYYNSVRPHQGKDIGNRRLRRAGGREDSEAARSPKDAKLEAKRNRIRDPVVSSAEEGVVKCGSRLGGLLRHYYRDAA